MIRIRRVSADAGGLAADTRALPSEAAARAAAPAEIIRDFADPYLEFVRLLREASEIEHALMVQYLYGAYSLKPAYAALRGFATPSAAHLLGVAIQEMQHLEKVNRMLVDLGAAPNLVRQDFPYESDIYPFPLNLEPLSRDTLAKYVYTEAPASALDRDDPANADPATQAFLDQFDAALGGVRAQPPRQPLPARSSTAPTSSSPPRSRASRSVRLAVRTSTPSRARASDAHFAVLPAGLPRHAPRVRRATRPWALPRGPRLPRRRSPLNPSALEGYPNRSPTEADAGASPGSATCTTG